MRTPAIFRRSSDQTVFAIFPTIPYTVNGIQCLAFYSKGTGGIFQGCEYCAAMETSCPATISEAARLSRLLGELGCRITPVKLGSPKQHLTRYRAAAAMRAGSS